MKINEKKFNDGLKIIEPPEDNWLLGANSKVGGDVVAEDGDWTKWFPIGERQKRARVEPMACVTFATLNSVEIQIKRLIDLGIIDTEPIKDWLDENNEINFSDRFLAFISGTTENGNSLNNPPEALRKLGCPPENIWPHSDDFTWSTYYKVPSTEAYKKGKELLNYFDFEWHWLPRTYLMMGGKMRGYLVVQHTISEALKQAPVVIGAATCPGWFGSEEIKACNLAANHASVIAGEKVGDYRIDFNSYEPHIKKLDWYYKIHFATQVFVKPKTNILKKNNMLTKILKDKNSTAVYLAFQMTNEAALYAMMKNIGIEPPTINNQPNTINWSQLSIDGEIEFK